MGQAVVWDREEAAAEGAAAAAASVFTGTEEKRMGEGERHIGKLKGKGVFIGKIFAGGGPPGLPVSAGIASAGIAGGFPLGLTPPTLVLPAESAGSSPVGIIIAGGVRRDCFRREKFKKF